MNTRRLFLRFLPIVIGAGMLGVGGCGALAMFELLGSTPRSVVVGGDAEQLLFTVRQRGHDDLSIPEGGEPTPKDLFVLDVETLSAAKIVSGIPAISEFPAEGYPMIVADGVRAAWVNVVDQTVEVRDLATGNESTLSLIEPQDDTSVLSLHLVEDRLVVHRHVGSEADYVVVDLDSGEQMHVPGSVSYGAFALAGDMMALVTQPDGDVEILGLEISANIDLVDLTTGDRQAIARNIRVSGRGPHLYATGGEIIWQQFRDGNFRTKIKAYDLASGEVRTLAEDIEPAHGSARLMGVWGDLMLIESAIGEPLLGETMWFETLSFNGTATEIVRFPNMLLKRQTYQARPRMVAGMVVWTDPYTGEFVVYDTATEVSRQFDPVEAAGSLE